MSLLVVAASNNSSTRCSLRENRGNGVGHVRSKSEPPHQVLTEGQNDAAKSGTGSILPACGGVDFMMELFGVLFVSSTRSNRRNNTSTTSTSTIPDATDGNQHKSKQDEPAGDDSAIFRNEPHLSSCHSNSHSKTTSGNSSPTAPPLLLPSSSMSSSSPSSSSSSWSTVSSSSCSMSSSPSMSSDPLTGGKNGGAGTSTTTRAMLPATGYQKRGRFLVWPVAY